MSELSNDVNNDDNNDPKVTAGGEQESLTAQTSQGQLESPEALFWKKTGEFTQTRLSPHYGLPSAVTAEHFLRLVYADVSAWTYIALLDDVVLLPGEGIIAYAGFTILTNYRVIINETVTTNVPLSGLKSYRLDGPLHVDWEADGRTMSRQLTGTLVDPAIVDAACALKAWASLTADQLSMLTQSRSQLNGAQLQALDSPVISREGLKAYLDTLDTLPWEQTDKITAIKRLKAETGAGLPQCKAAADESSNYAQAISLLHEQGHKGPPAIQTPSAQLPTASQPGALKGCLSLFLIICAISYLGNWMGCFGEGTRSCAESCRAYNNNVSGHEWVAYYADGAGYRGYASCINRLAKRGAFDDGTCTEQGVEACIRACEAAR